MGVPNGDDEKNECGGVAGVPERGARCGNYYFHSTNWSNWVTILNILRRIFNKRPLRGIGRITGSPLTETMYKNLPEYYSQPRLYLKLTV